MDKLNNIITFKLLILLLVGMLKRYLIQEGVKHVLNFHLLWQQPKKELNASRSLLQHSTKGLSIQIKISKFRSYPQISYQQVNKIYFTTLFWQPDLNNTNHHVILTLILYSNRRIPITDLFRFTRTWTITLYKLLICRLTQKLLWQSFSCQRREFVELKMAKIDVVFKAFFRSWQCFGIRG